MLIVQHKWVIKFDIITHEIILNLNILLLYMYY